MSVQSQIDRIVENVANTYNVLSEVGAEMPQTRNSNNLPGTAASISAVLYGKEQQLSDEQKEQARSNIGITETIRVTVTMDSNGKYTADKTIAELIEALENGHELVCVAHIDNIPTQTQFLTYRVDDEQTVCLFSASFGEGATVIVMFLSAYGEETVDCIISEPPVQELDLQSLTIKIGDDSVTYNGKTVKTFKIDSLKNPHSLTINGVSYDGSEEVNLTLDKMLSGSTSDITPTQVVEALASGRNIALNHNDPNYGDVVFTGFTIYMSLNVVTASGLNEYNGESMRFSLVGNIASGEWHFIYNQIDTKMNSVKIYGAKGNGSTDDTTAFQNALAANRVVTVPGGTYKLSSTLVIRENCCLELSQDTILQFTQTSGNCIEMRGSAVLRGNHAVISAAFGMTGNVISMDTLQDGTNHASIPPYTRGCPQWKRQRFVYDVNIVMPNTSGFNRPLSDGKCSGTAIYMSATNLAPGTDNPNNADIAFMWGIIMSGIRIAGGFSYGIHAVNYDSPAESSGHYTDDAWNHDMRIEAVIEGCEIGVELENCNGARLNVTVQPNTSDPGGTKYAKQGVCLRDSRFVDMMRSRVWDWHIGRNDSEEYKHLALYGNCRGLLLDDFLVTEHPNTDIRDDIYTDTPANFDTMTILQEPGNKYFKSIDNTPYFNNGTTNRKLMLATDKFSAEQAEFIRPADGYYTYDPNFTNLVTSVGYTDGKFMGNSGSESSGDSTKTLTGYIPVNTGAKIIRIGGEGISFDSYGCTISFYDADKGLIGSYTYDKLNSGGGWGNTVEDDTVAVAWDTTSTTHGKNGVFMRVSAKGKGANLIITVDEPQDYTAIWHGKPKRLDESIHAVTDWNAKEGEVGYIKNKPTSIGGGGSYAPADWNAAEGEPGHILNRTHWSKYENVTLIDNETLLDDGMPLNFLLTEGVTYKIVFDGVEYTDTAISADMAGMSVVLLGNGGYVGAEDINPDAPYTFVSMEGMGTVHTCGGYVVTLSGVLETVHKLPEKYLPDIRPYYVDTIVADGQVFTAQMASELEKAYLDGRYIAARYPFADAGVTVIYPLCMVGDDFSVVVFANGDVGLRFAKNDLGGYDVSTVDTSPTS